MRLRYTSRAAAELDEILSYIGARSPTGATKVMRRVQGVVDLLLRHPDAGLKTSRAGLRRIVARPYPYLVFYSVTAEEIVIHGVRHGARRPFPAPDRE